LDKIKIAHIITQLELGGAQENTLYTATNLDPALYETYLIAGSGGLLDQDARINLGERLLLVPTLVRQLCPGKDLLSLIKIYNICRRYHFDIVHTHSSKAGILGRWAARLAGVKVIVHTFHGFGFNDAQKFWTRWFFIRLEQITARFSSKLIVVSAENTKKALKLGIGHDRQYQVIHSGIKTAAYRVKVNSAAEKNKLGLPPDSRVVGMIACFKPQKAPLDFVRMAAEVSKELPETCFLMVGDGELRPQIEKLSRELGLEKRLILSGWRRDANIVLQIMDVVVLTSLWEGLPRVVVEAFVSRKPVVATPADGVKEVIKDGLTGYLAGFHQPGLMAEKVIYLLKNPAAATQMTAAAAALIQASGDFDIDEMVQEQSRLYLKILTTGV
jgi:glycosyltransferase involved in cell wall biosynthesis